MALEVTTNKVFADGNDVATVFSFDPVRIRAEEDLIVALIDNEGNEGDPLTLGVDYSTTPTSGQYPDTGSVTYPLVGDPLPTGWQLLMYRNTEQLQRTRLENQGGYNPKVQEQTFDVSRMIDQDQEERIGRVLTVSVGAPAGFDGTFKATPDTAPFISSDGLSVENVTRDELQGDPGPQGPQGPSGDGLTQISSDDTTGDFLEQKIAKAGLTLLSTLFPGGNEQLQIDVPIATQAEAEAGVIDDKAMTPLKVLQSILANSSSISAVGSTINLDFTQTTDAAWPKSNIGDAPGVLSIVWGGGGSGGHIGAGTVGNSKGAGSGGGQGGGSIKWIPAASLNATEARTIGSGGGGSTSTSNPGGTTSFGTHHDASGGGGGSTTGVLSTGDTIQARGGAGGVGSNGDINFTGAAGHTCGGGVNSQANGGNGGGLGGGVGRSANSTSGGNGQLGGGGGGAALNGTQGPWAGADGGDGWHLLIWITNTLT